MKSECSILISNANSTPAIELCIESIKAYTHYPNYKIIVYDDNSTNNMDLHYLRQRQFQGWLTLIEGKQTIGHGGSLNMLVNEICNTPLAMILDCDIQILRSDWLCEIVEFIGNYPKVILSCRSWPSRRRNERTMVGPFCELWFAMLNMEAYRDNMQVDWQPQLIEGKNTMRDVYHIHDENTVNMVYDVGSQLYIKVLFDNPKGYEIISLPPSVYSRFRHWGQISTLNSDNQLNGNIHKLLDRKKTIINMELYKLRSQFDFQGLSYEY